MGMSKVRTEAVYSLALWTRTLPQVWACVKHVYWSSLVRSTLNTNVITGLGMCRVCAAAVNGQKSRKMGLKGEGGIQGAERSAGTGHWEVVFFQRVLMVVSLVNHICWWFRNPVNSPVEVGSLSHYLQAFLLPGGAGFLNHQQYLHFFSTIFLFLYFETSYL